MLDTPYDKLYGESLKRRVLNNYKDIIKNIEVVGLKDLENENVKKYDCVIYCDCANPIKDKGVQRLKVNYYFNNQDVRNFYEEMYVPSHIYHRSFGDLHVDDYYVDYHYKGIDEIKKILFEKAKSDDVRRQIDKFEPSLFNLHNGVLNITLYCNDRNEAFSKLFFLERHVSEKDYRFNRIFVHCIALNYDLYALRTTEKVMRNIVVIDDTSEVIAKEPFIDFYEYYIGNESKVLPK